MRFIKLTSVHSAHGQGTPWFVNVQSIDGLEPVRAPEKGTYVQVGNKETWVKETFEEILKNMGAEVF